MSLPVHMAPKLGTNAERGFSEGGITLSLMHRHPTESASFYAILAGLFPYCVLVCGTPLPPSAVSDQCTRPAPTWRIPDSALRDSSSTCSLLPLVPSQTTFPFFFGNGWCGLNPVRPAKLNSSSASGCQVLIRLPTGDLRELNPAAAHSLSGTRPGHTAARLSECQVGAKH